MNVPSFIARRYLFSKKSRNVINIISGISMFVVACVTASMICIMSAFNGIEELVEGLFTTFDSQISISPVKGKTMEFSEDTLQLIAAQPFVENTCQIIEDDAIFRYQGNPTVAKILGVDSAYKSITGIKSKIVNGEYRISSESAFATLGYGIKTELGLSNPTDINSQLLSVSTPIRGKKLSKYREKALKTEAIAVSGVFSVNAELDVKYVIVPIHFARDILGYSN
ncbi:MAG: ABC transporter permease, partial [Bacteroidota bacterium]